MYKRQVKDFVMRIGYDLSASKETAAISNVGKIDMPPELREYIRLFDVFVSTSRLQVCMCSFGDQLTASFTAPFVSTDIQKNFFRFLTCLLYTSWNAWRRWRHAWRWRRWPRRTGRWILRWHKHIPVRSRSFPSRISILSLIHI